jgi:glycerophosphoryl diester phosphodiesterase
VPQSRPHPALAGQPLGFAHRGFTRTGAPENTIASFRAAYDLGLRHLETDVRATADGVCVVVHDATLRRVAGRDERIADLPWDVLRAVDLGGGEAVPSLDDVLDLFPDCVFSVDCKSADAVRPLIRSIQRAGAQARVVVASFDGSRSRAVADGAPGVARSPGRWGVLGAVVAAALWRAGARPVARAVLGAACRGCDLLQVPQRQGRLAIVTPALVDLAHACGLQVHVWTVDDARDMRRLLAAGIDGLVSDRSDVLAAVLADVARPPAD